VTKKKSFYEIDTWNCLNRCLSQLSSVSVYLRKRGMGNELLMSSSLLQLSMGQLSNMLRIASKDSTMESNECWVSVLKNFFCYVNDAAAK
jgi:hypothetical protein